jgi:tellurite resistance protein TehA-like permease
VINGIVFYQTISINSLQDNSALGLLINLEGILGGIFLIAGVILTILSHIRREERNYQYKVSVWGFSFFVLMAMIAVMLPLFSS